MNCLSDWSRADVIAAFSLFVALFALAVAWHAVLRSNQNSSASTFVTLNEGFREAWDRLFEARRQHPPAADQPDAIDLDVQYRFSELMNLFELACALHHEKSLVGVSRELAEEYIAHVLQHISDDATSFKMMEAALDTPTTGKYIWKFIEYLRKSGKDKTYRIRKLPASRN